jgi:heme exporter protein B
MTTAFFNVVFSILRKDLRAELRSRELVNTMALFTLLSILIFSFALELDRQARQEVIAGVVWVTLVFASILGLNRNLATERENGGLQATLIAPVGRSAIYWGKLVGNFLFVLVIGLILLPLATILYNTPLVRLEMLLALILGTLGITSTGTLLATMTVQTRSRETLLPIVMMPVVLPVLILVVRGTNGVLQGTSDGNWLVTLLVVDVIYLVLGSLLFEFVIED